MSEYRHKVVLVTGGSSGVGEAVAKKFARKGAIVYIAGRNKDKLQQTKSNLKEIGETVFIVQGDVSKEEDCKQMVQTVICENSRLDILVNCAGMYVEKPTEKTTESEWDSIIDTNLKGTFMMCKSATSHLIKTKGCIVNTSSTAGIVGFNGVAAYCASKGGINLLTKSLAMEYAKFGVRVNVVCPDMIDTKMLDADFKQSEFEDREEYDKFNLSSYPQGIENSRYIQPEEVADCILFLASDEKAKTITGTSIVMDFGLTAGF